MLTADALPTRRPKPAFGRWLIAQANKPGALGHLARCAAADRAFPKDGTPDQVSCRLNAVGADGDLHDALEDAALDWAAA